MRRGTSPILALSLLLLLGWLNPVLAAKRVALVIGNDTYPNLSAGEQLKKAGNDARTTAQTLKALDFEVEMGLDLDRSSLNLKLQQFVNRLEPGDEAAFFFAGHGVQLDGRNYLLPSDVPKIEEAHEGFLKTESIPIDSVMDMIKTRQPRLLLLVIDACRNNPFKDSRGRSIGGSRGLASLAPPEGTLVLFSAGAGQIALDRLSNDDPHPNSVFTRIFLPLVAQPGLPLSTLARQVRAEVRDLARSVGHQQTPAVHDEVIGEIYLAGRSIEVDKRTLGPAPPASDPAKQAWEAVEASYSVAVLEAFAAEFPDSVYARFARARIEELRKAAEDERVALATPPAQPSPAQQAEPAVGLFEKPEAERQYKAGDTLKDCDTCPEMVVVPAGEFLMGSPPREGDRSDAEGPQRRVTIARPFAVGQFEVTFEQWDACVADGGCNGYKPSDEDWGRGSRPVINVTWEDARAFTYWLSRKTRQGYRLLSEAEWEYAARAGTTSRFSCGDDDGCLNQVAWYSTDFGIGPHPVGSRAANRFSLYDMHGNVWEWVEDCWNENYNGAPVDGSAWTSGDCGARVLRGGSWGYLPKSLRSATRHRSRPVQSTFYGFRVARNLGAAPLVDRAALEDPTPARMIREVYDNGWYADPKENPANVENRNLTQSYFTPEFIKLIEMNNMCWDRFPDKEGVQIWVAGSDTDVSDVRVSVAESAADAQTVVAKLKNFGEDQTWTFKLRHYGGKWLIEDIGTEWAPSLAAEIRACLG